SRKCWSKAAITAWIRWSAPILSKPMAARWKCSISWKTFPPRTSCRRFVERPTPDVARRNGVWAWRGLGGWHDPAFRRRGGTATPCRRRGPSRLAAAPPAPPTVGVWRGLGGRQSRPAAMALPPAGDQKEEAGALAVVIDHPVGLAPFSRPPAR